MGRREFADTRKLQLSGNSIVASLPKAKLREYGLVDEDGEVREDAEARPYIDEDRGVLGVEVDLE